MNRRLVLSTLTALFLAACGKRGAESRADADANLTKAKAFMAENAKAEGVKSFPDGLQYKIVRQGPGEGPNPRPQDLVKVHYEGKLTDGFVFDSSYERGAPAVFTLRGLVPAWIEALQQMKAGDEWTLWVPPELGYGAEAKGPIPANSVMIFRIELIDVSPQGG